MRTEVIYTFPYETTAALRAVAEIEQMGDLDALEASVRADSTPEGKEDGGEAKAPAAPAPSMLERIGELRTRREEMIATLPPVRQVRVLVRAVKYNDTTHYRLLYKEGMDWFKAQTKQELDADLGGKPELIALRDMAVFRAEMLCAIDRERRNGQTVYLCEHRSYPYGRPVTATWETGVLPAEWSALDSMGDSLPMDFFDEWLAATRELNVGVLSSIPFFLRKKRASRSVIA